MKTPTKVDKLRAWYPTALHLVAQLERVRELVSLSQSEISEGVEPWNWPTLRRYVRDGAKQAQHAQRKLAALGLTVDDIPAVPERELVELGGHCFNSALIAIGWTMELWATVGTALDESLAIHADPMEIPPGIWRFFAILYPSATSKGKIDESGRVFWIHNWINTPLAIDRRICSAGIESELSILERQEPEGTATLTATSEKTFPFYVACLRHRDPLIQNFAAELNAKATERTKTKVLIAYSKAELNTPLSDEDAARYLDVMALYERRHRR